MKKVIYLIFFIPIILVAQNSLQTLKKDKYNYIVKVGEVVMCPYLGPKMIKTFDDMGAKNIIKSDSLETLSFELDSLYTDLFITDIFINKIGLPKWSIYEITILENEK